MMGTLTLDALGADTFRQSEAARAGLSSRSLYRLASSGAIEQIGRGLYRRSDAPTGDLDLMEIAGLRPLATLCLATALVRHGLTDAIPSETDAAIPRGSRAPSTIGATRWHFFDRETFGLGREEITIAGSSARIGLYSAERTIADMFRLRGAEGYEAATEALREWLGRTGSRPADLIQMATRLPRAEGPIRTALEFLG